MEALKLKVWKPNVNKISGLKVVKSAYQNGEPYLTKSRVCSICGPSSDVISM